MLIIEFFSLKAQNHLINSSFSQGYFRTNPAAYDEFFIMSLGRNNWFKNLLPRNKLELSYVNYNYLQNHNKSAPSLIRVDTDLFLGRLKKRSGKLVNDKNKHRIGISIEKYAEGLMQRFNGGIRYSLGLPISDREFLSVGIGVNFLNQGFQPDSRLNDEQNLFQSTNAFYGVAGFQWRQQIFRGSDKLGIVFYTFGASVQSSLNTSLFEAKYELFLSLNELLGIGNNYLESYVSLGARFNSLEFEHIYYSEAFMRLHFFSPFKKEWIKKNIQYSPTYGVHLRNWHQLAFSTSFWWNWNKFNFLTGLSIEIGLPSLNLESNTYHTINSILDLKVLFRAK